MADIPTKIVVTADDQTAQGLGTIQSTFAGLGARMGVIAGSLGIGRVTTAFGNVLSAMGRVRAAVQPLINSLATITGISGVGSVAALTQQFVAANESMETMARTAMSLGMMPETLNEIAGVARRMNIPMEELSSSLRTVHTRFQLFQTGQGRGLKNLEALDPAFASAFTHAKSAADATDLLMGRLHELVTQGPEGMAKAQALLRALGIRGTALTQLAGMTDEEFADARAKVRLLTGDFTDQMAEIVKKFNDTRKDVEDAWQGIVRAVTVQVDIGLQPALEGLRDWLVENRPLIVSQVSGLITDITQWFTGERVAPHLGRYFVKSGFTQIKEWFETFKGAVTGTVNALGGWKNVMLAITLLEFAPLGAALWDVGKAIAALGAAVLSTPIGWILAIAGAGYLMYTNWNTVGPAIDKAAKAMGAESGWQAIKESVGGLASSVGNLITQLTDLFKQLVGTEWLGTEFNKFLEGTAADLQHLKEMIDGIMVGIRWLKGENTQQFGPWQPGKNPYEKGGKYEGAENPSAGSYLWNRFFGGGNTGKSSLPEGFLGRAAGGPVSAGSLAIVGEHGPELAYFGSNANIIPNDVLGSGLKENALSSLLMSVVRVAIAPLKPISESISDLTRVMRDLVQWLNEHSTSGLGGYGGAGGYSGPHNREGTGFGGYSPSRGYSGPHNREGTGWGGRRGTGLIGGGRRISIPNAVDLILQAGGTLEEAQLLGALTGQESSGNPMARNTKGEYSMGLWQVNMRTHGTKYGTESELMDPLANARAALDIYHKQGLGAWANTVRTRRYQQDLIESRKYNPYGKQSFAAPLETHNFADARIVQAFKSALDTMLVKKLELGRAEVKVTMSHDGSIRKVRTASSGAVHANVGTDNTGARIFKPAPYVRPNSFVT